MHELHSAVNKTAFHFICRQFSSYEKQAMVDFYSNKFTCNYDELPPEAMAHYFLEESTAMDQYVNCMKEKRTRNTSINACKTFIKDICGSHRVETSLNARCHNVIAATKTIIDHNPSTGNESYLLQLLQDFLYDHGISLQYSNRLIEFIRHGLCIERMRFDNNKCLHIAKRKCKNDVLLVVQVNRMKMEDLEPLIITNPAIYVVHYTRDPRGILVSRYRMHKLPFDKIESKMLKETKYLCHKMREDLRQRKQLERKYPGVFTYLTYENLAVDPEGFATKMYGIFNKSSPKKWRSFIGEHMYGKREAGHNGITVKNARITAFRWRSEIPKHHLDKMTSICADVIISLGYHL